MDHASEGAPSAALVIRGQPSARAADRALHGVQEGADLTYARGTFGLETLGRRPRGVVARLVARQQQFHHGPLKPIETFNHTFETLDGRQLSAPVVRRPADPSVAIGPRPSRNSRRRQRYGLRPILDEPDLETIARKHKQTRIHGPDLTAGLDEPAAHQLTHEPVDCL